MELRQLRRRVPRLCRRVPTLLLAGVPLPVLSLWCLDCARVGPVTRVLQRARLQLPRDLQVAYTVGRMGAVTMADLWPLFWGSLDTARFGFRRLVNLKLL